jgi:hypothetical protein
MRGELRAPAKVSPRRGPAAGASAAGGDSRREFDLPALRKFRASWPNQNLRALKKLEYLRSFFR